MVGWPAFPLEIFLSSFVGMASSVIDLMRTAPRVNGFQVPTYVGRAIDLVGKVTAILAGGRINLETPDHQVICIQCAGGAPAM